MFKIYNYKNNETFDLNDEQLKEFIINTTHSRYENLSVTSERTGKRPSFLKDSFETLLKGTLIEGLFLITALGRVNSDKRTRYMLVSIGDKNSYNALLPYINDYVPFFHIDCSAYTPTHEGGYLSSWFRQTMGRAFSFIDIDFLFLKNENLFLIEEKTNNATLGYGQKMSYSELMTDIFKKTPTLILVSSSKDKCLLKISKGNFTDKYREGALSIEDFINWLNK